MKKSILFILSALLLPLVACADHYKILYMNSPTIKIGDRECKTGDVFSDLEIIFWAKDKQAFKAQNTTTKAIRLFAEPDFRQNGSKTVKDYFLRKNHLSTRGAMSLSELETYLADTFFLLDSISVETTEMTDSLHCFLMSYDNEGTVVKKELPGTDGTFFITRSLFPPTADSTSVFTLTISYVNKKIEEEYQLTDAMKIVLLSLDGE